jgi:hypothetical protein
VDSPAAIKASTSRSRPVNSGKIGFVLGCALLKKPSTLVAMSGPKIASRLATACTARTISSGSASLST